MKCLRLFGCLAVLFLLIGVMPAHTAAPLPLVLRQKKEEEQSPLMTRAHILKMLRRTVKFNEVNDKTLTLAELLDQIAKAHRIEITLNEMALIRDGYLGDPWKFEIGKSGVIPSMHKPLECVLRQIMKRFPSRSGIVMLVRRSTLEITTEKAARLEFGMPAAKNGERLRLICEEFNSVPLEDALQTLADRSDTNFLLDPRAAKQGQTKVRARFMNTPVEKTAGVLADMAGLDVVRQANVFYVTTPENAGRLRKRDAATK